MSGVIFDNRIGAENLQLAAFETLQANINAYIAAEETRGLVIDQRYAAAAGKDVKNTSIEKFNKPYIYFGHRPSMIEAPVGQYPSMSCVAYEAAPAQQNSQNDYGHSLAIKLVLEAIVKSGPYPQNDTSGLGEDIVNRRAHRTVEAIFQLFQDHGNLGGEFYPPSTPPLMRLGDIYARDEDGGSDTGDRWYWQGIRIEFTYLKQTVFGMD